MMTRCYDRRYEGFHNYGGRGITVCHEWHSLKAACAYLKALPYKLGQTLDRIDCNGNYEPGNVRFAFPLQQAMNKRNTLRISFKGKTQTLKEWSVELGMNYDCLLQRVARNKWPIELALTAPVGKWKGGSRKISTNVFLEHGGTRLTLMEWSKRLGWNYGLLLHRVQRGWPVDRILTERPGANHGGARPCKAHAPQ